MPTLFRFLLVVGIVSAVIYVGAFSLAHLVVPQPREMTVIIPQDKLFKPQ